MYFSLKKKKKHVFFPDAFIIITLVGALRKRYAAFERGIIRLNA